MSINITETTNQTVVAESSAYIALSEVNPHLTVIENETNVEVTENAITPQVIEIGHPVTVTAGGTTVVEVQTPGPKGDPGGSEKGPAFMYVGGSVSRVDYDSGAYKTLSYSAGRLMQVDYVKEGTTIRKSFVYNSSGILTEVVQTTL